MAVDWSKRGEYIAKRNLTPAQADGALTDPDRTIGYSPSVGAILTVITVYNHVDGITYGANAWKANERDRRYYQQGGMDDE